MREVITPAQVAALLQIHVKTVYRLARQGVLPGQQIGRRWRFSRAEILALVSRPWAGLPTGAKAESTRPRRASAEPDASGDGHGRQSSQHIDPPLDAR